VEDIIKMDLKTIGWKDMDWIHLAQDRNQWQALVNMVMKLRVLQELYNFLTILATVSIEKGLCSMDLDESRAEGATIDQ
jgi:hypothetical protein